MFVASIPKNDVGKLAGEGCVVKINAKPETVKRIGNCLCWREERRPILEESSNGSSVMFVCGEDEGGEYHVIDALRTSKYVLPKEPSVRDQGFRDTTAFGEWLCGVHEELNDGKLTAARIGLVQEIGALQNEAVSGVFHDANGGMVVVENAELAELIFTACAENWLGSLAEGEGRHADRRRHMAAFIEAEKQIYSDRFTPEEQGKAWQILD